MNGQELAIYSCLTSNLNQSSSLCLLSIGIRGLESMSLPTQQDLPFLSKYPDSHWTGRMVPSGVCVLGGRPLLCFPAALWILKQSHMPWLTAEEQMVNFWEDEDVKRQIRVSTYEFTWGLLSVKFHLQRNWYHKSRPLRWISEGHNKNSILVIKYLIPWCSYYFHFCCCDKAFCPKATCREEFILIYTCSGCRHSWTEAQGAAECCLLAHS